MYPVCDRDTMKNILCVLSVLLVGIVGVNSLQCYVCDNCPAPTKADLVSCDDPVTTAPTQSTATTSSTSAGSSTSSSTTSSTTSTTSATPSITSSTPSTTSTASSTTSSTPSTTSSTPSTTLSTPSTSSAAPVQSNESLSDLTIRRSKRSILSLMNSNKTACNCKNEVGCNCDNSLSGVSTYADYVCFKVVMKKDNVIVRGCAPATLDSKAPCQVEDVIAAVSSCSTCDTDQCNSGYMTQFSVYMTVATIGVVLFK